MAGIGGDREWSGGLLVGPRFKFVCMRFVVVKVIGVFLVGRTERRGKRKWVNSC